MNIQLHQQENITRLEGLFAEDPNKIVVREDKLSMS